MKARSLNGCWTCRVRRKKCDESLPSCSHCMGLNLSCDGYGAKPAWLDGGVLEKAKALKIKSLVKQAIKRRARSLSNSATLPDILVSRTDPQLGMTWYSSTSEEQPTPGNGLCSFDQGIDMFSLWDDSHFSPKINEDPLSISEGALDHLKVCNTSMNESLVSCREGIISTPHFQTRPRASPQSIPFQIQPNTEASIRGPDSVLDSLWNLDNSNPGDESAFSSDIDVVSTASSKKSSATEGDLKHNELLPSSKASSDLNACWALSGNEAVLLMHYFDHAFYTQFPYYSPSAHSSGRGWLLTLLTGDRTIYYATLAFSQHDLDSRSPDKPSSFSGDTRHSEKIDNYALALNHLQFRLGEAHTWSGSAGLVCSIKALACILQFVFLEVWSSSSGNWSFHLRAADALLPSLVDARAKWLDTGNRQSPGQESYDLCCLSNDDHHAIEFLLSAFLWINILAQVSTRAKVSSQTDPEVLLGKGDIHLERLFGCDNWVVLLMFKVFQLDSWKRECEKNRKLSVAELVRQGTKIEDDLNQGLANISVSESCPRQIPSSEDNCSKITECFGFAVLTYLHVVVSGPHPDLPEIEESVSRGINAIEALKERRLLNRVVWPVCVIGCMVSGSKKSEFRSLITGRDVADMVVGTFPRAVEIIEHCWKKRETGPGDYDWFSAMKSLGQYILLL